MHPTRLSSRNNTACSYGKVLAQRHCRQVGHQGYMQISTLQHSILRAHQLSAEKTLFHHPFVVARATVVETRLDRSGRSKKTRCSREFLVARCTSDGASGAAFVRTTTRGRTSYSWVSAESRPKHRGEAWPADQMKTRDGGEGEGGGLGLGVDAME
jgi:hypothetical protein